MVVATRKVSGAEPLHRLRSRRHIVALSIESVGAQLTRADVV